MFSPQKQNMRASKKLDFPDPFGPITDVKPKNGPIYDFSSKLQINY